ncbi:MAG: hypothetical protein JST82_12475 [Bacteroidetes bacterium]|nr:hypothetical protein [Bacteroidota bacterium]
MDNSQKQLFKIKLLHTAIWLVLAPIVLYVLWCGVTGNITVYSWLATAAIIIEGLVLLLFKGSCPLTVMARRYSDSTKDNFDIFLPNWLAKYNKIIFTSIFVVGLALMVYREFMK